MLKILKKPGTVFFFDQGDGINPVFPDIEPIEPVDGILDGRIPSLFT